MRKSSFNLAGYLRPLLVVTAILAVAAFTYTGRPGTVQLEGRSIIDLLERGEAPFSRSDLQALFPSATGLAAQPETDLPGVVDADDELLGFVVYGPPPGKEIIGYNGPVPFLLGLDPERTIRGVRLLPNRETRAYANLVAREMADAWNDLRPAEAYRKQVDAVTGATYTSRALIRGVERTLHGLSGDDDADLVMQAEDINRQLIFQLLVVWFLIIALGHFFLPSVKVPRLRLMFNLLSLLVPGLLAASMLSLSLLGGWLHYGLRSGSHWLLLGVALIAWLIPLVYGKNFYCNYYCPYGAAQDLLGRIRRKKVRISPRWVLGLRYVRLVLLLAAALILVFNLTLDLAVLEPFAAFRWRLAPASSRLLAVIFLVLAIWIPRPWCRICPTGGLINFMKRKVG